MAKIFTFLFFLSSFYSWAEFNIKIYYEPIENGYAVYADNMEFCPVSIKLSFTVENMRVEGGNNKTYVVLSRKTKQLLTTIKPIKNGKKFKFSYKSRYNYGDDFLATYDDNYIYNLPFNKSQSFKIHQGYNGSFSHQNSNALDFTMPVGTEITAIRDGVVVKVIDSITKSCKTENCKKYNNLIIIYHPDGSFAEYTHIKNKGSMVQIGDEIKKDQVIALSGNVGFSTGPHLHLVIFLQKLEQRRTLKTKFKTESGDNYLLEKQEYLRSY